MSSQMLRTRWHLYSICLIPRPLSSLERRYPPSAGYMIYDQLWSTDTAEYLLFQLSMALPEQLPPSTHVLRPPFPVPVPVHATKGPDTTRKRPSRQLRCLYKKEPSKGPPFSTTIDRLPRLSPPRDIRMPREPTKKKIKKNLPSQRLVTCTPPWLKIQSRAPLSRF